MSCYKLFLYTLLLYLFSLPNMNPIFPHFVATSHPKKKVSLIQRKDCSKERKNVLYEQDKVILKALEQILNLLIVD